MFQFAKRILSFEVSRETEFYPIKSNSKEDSILQAKRSLSNLHKSWLLKKNYYFVNTDHKKEQSSDTENIEADKNSFCEISPLVSYDGTYFTKLPKNRELILPFVLKQQ